MAAIRKTGRRSELDAAWKLINRLLYGMYAAVSSGAIGNGTTAGRLRTTASADFAIAGLRYTKASTDNLWNLSGEATTDAGVYRAYWLYLDASGTASFAAGAGAASVADAVAALPALDTAKSVLGVYVAGAATNFANALAAQGTIYNGVPAGVPGVSDAAIEPATLINP